MECWLHVSCQNTKHTQNLPNCTLHGISWRTAQVGLYVGCGGMGSLVIKEHHFAGNCWQTFKRSLLPSVTCDWNSHNEQLHPEWNKSACEIPVYFIIPTNYTIKLLRQTLQQWKHYVLRCNSHVGGFSRWYSVASTHNSNNNNAITRQFSIDLISIL